MARVLAIALVSLAAAGVVPLCTAAEAAPALALASPALSDSAVLQRGVPIPVHGVATAGAAVALTWHGSVHRAFAGADGRWLVTLPPSAASAKPQVLNVTAGGGGGAQVLTLEVRDLLVGDVFFCSGQSNMVRSIDVTSYYHTYMEDAAQLAPMLRAMRVAEVAAPLQGPATNFTAVLPWQRASNGSTFMDQLSATCYYRAVNALRARPDVPVGAIESAWGGTPIQVWMDPASLQSCGVNGTETSSERPAHADVHAWSPSTGGANPTTPSVLYNNMIAPLLTTPIKQFLWYQGEANSGAATLYGCLFPAMIAQWRSAWAAASGGGMGPHTPFVFVQLSSWPKQDDGTIPDTRYAQTRALALPNVSMAVAGDIGDPSSPFHPVHSVWKHELARRLHLASEAIVYGNTSVPKLGPQVVSVRADYWDTTWGAFHFGTGSAQILCPTQAATCLGLRVTFDRPVQLRASWGNLYGFENGFRVWDVSRARFQRLTLIGVLQSDSATIQLNATFVAGGLPGYLTYGWSDYPTLLIEDDVYGRPVAPFNATFNLRP